MINKKNIIIFLFSLFVFFSTNGVGNSIATYQKQNSHIETSGNISQSSSLNDTQNISPIEGILQTSIKVNESNSPTFQNFKNSKKTSTLISFLQSFLFSKSYYLYYCSNRTNGIIKSPFYIAYHRLII